MYDLDKRIRRAAEGILEDEGLTDGLDDAAAQALLNWGVTCAETIAHDTGDLSDTEAETAMVPRLRATRRLMRYVRQWVVNGPEMDAQAGAEQWSKIVEQAATVYGDFAPPGDDQCGAWWSRWPDLTSDPVGMIVYLRTLVEGASTDSINPGGRNDQAIHDAT